MIASELSVSGIWTLDAYAIHQEALRVADARFGAERDQRYAEVAIERDKALKIKETADLAALELAREIQTYKEEKAAARSEQVSSDWGSMATKEDLVSAIREVVAQITPLADYVAAQRGQRAGVSSAAAVVITLVTTLVACAGLALGIYAALK